MILLEQTKRKLGWGEIIIEVSRRERKGSHDVAMGTDPVTGTVTKRPLWDKHFKAPGRDHFAEKPGTFDIWFMRHGRAPCLGNPLYPPDVLLSAHFHSSIPVI
jgi:hypothetical protein